MDFHEMEELGSEMEDKELVYKFISEHIKQRTCSTYIPTTGTKNCHCGRPGDAHLEKDENNMASPDLVWTPEEHTKPAPADSYGTIRFTGPGCEQSHNIPYVRLDEQIRHDNLGNVWNLLKKIWKMKTPETIISMTGGTRSIHLKDKKKFKRALMDVATNLGAWIITDGTGIGLAKLVGEAVKEHQPSADRGVVALGITTWGIVDHRSALQGKTRNGCFPAQYPVDKLIHDEYSATLDPNHTHFLLVDDGTEERFGREIVFRASLEKYVSTQTGISGGMAAPVPAILLVLGGEVNTLRTVLEELKRGTPVIVIQGTGPAADFITMAHRDNTVLDKKLDYVDEQGHYKNLHDLCDSTQMDEQDREAEVAKCLEHLRGILSAEYNQLVNIIAEDDFDNAKKMNQTILRALFKAGTSNAQSQLDLAIHFKGLDIYKQLAHTSIESLDLNNAMMNVLLQGSADFVQFFLEKGFSLSEFLTRDRLRELYNKVLTMGKGSTGQSLVKEKLQKHQTMFEDSMQSFPMKRGYSDSLMTIGELIQQLLGKKSRNVYLDKEGQNIENTARDLFFWSLLLNYQDLAEVFWKIGRDHIGGAITASIFLVRLGRMASEAGEQEEAKVLDQEANHWESLACEVLNDCYKRDQKKAHQLLVRKLPTWGNRTLFAMANTGKKMAFMGHSCCQTKLNEIWTGKMGFQTPRWKMWLSMIFPIFVGIIHFNDDHNSLTKTNHDNTGDPHRMRFDGDQLQGRNNALKFLRHIYSFYTAPCIKFGNYIVSTLVFLGLFSFVVMTQLDPIDTKPLSVYECILWGWAGTLFLEEIRELATKDTRNILGKLGAYLKSYWNKFDAVIYALFILSMILRIVLNKQNFGWARVSYSITIIFYFLRTLQFFLIMKSTGPKVIMINRMLKDLIFIGAIMLTVVTGYGVAVQSLQLPKRNATLALFTDVFYKPYYNIYGELFLDDVEGSIIGCDQSSETEKCPPETWIASFLFAGYMALTNILLLNLLIAMFSFTFQKVQENSEDVWQFHRYILIYEYCNKPTLAPPLIIFNLFWRVVRFIWVKCKKPTVDTDFRMNLSMQDYKRLTKFERAGMENYLLKCRNPSQADRLQKMNEDIESIKRQLSGNTGVSALEWPLQEHSRKLSAFTGTSDKNAVNDPNHNFEHQLRTQEKNLSQVVNAVNKIQSNNVILSAFMTDIKSGQIRLQQQVDSILQKLNATNVPTPGHSGSSS